MKRHGIIVLLLASTVMAEDWTVEQDGSGDFESIQAAVDAASDGDSIFVGPGLWGSDAGPDVPVVEVIGKSVSLYGTMDGSSLNTVIHGSLEAPCLYIENMAEEQDVMTVQGFIFAYGYSRVDPFIGGGVSVLGAKVNFASCNFSQCGSEFNGGGLYAWQAVLGISECNFESCGALEGAGAYLWQTDGSMSLTNFFDNEATSGGGLCLSQSSPNMTDLLFLGNEAAFGGGMFSVQSDPTMTGVGFVKNKAHFYGGGLLCQESSPTLQTGEYNCVFDVNSAHLGGGIYCLNADPTMNSVDFHNNRAINGAAMYMQQSSPTGIGCTFESNEADSSGGALFVVQGDPSMDNCHFERNESERFGGAMYMRQSTPTITNCTFYRNSAIDIYPKPDEDLGFLTMGGAIFGAWSSPVISDCLFDNNAAVIGGAISLEHENVGTPGGGGQGGGNDGGGGGPASNWARLTNCEFLTNAGPMAGGALRHAAGHLEVSGCSFLYNDSVDVVGAFGGALLFEDGSTASVHGSIIRENYAYHGGGVIVRGASSPTFFNSTFTENEGTVSGGGVEILGDSSASFVECTLSSNVQGAVLVTDSEVEFTASTLNSNTGTNGPAVRAINSVVRIIDSTLEANVAGGNGGAASFEAGTDSEIIGSAFVLNIASGLGGAVYIEAGVDSEVDIGNTFFCNNIPTPQIDGPYNDMGDIAYDGACEAACLGDLTGSGVVDGEDITVILNSWGACEHLYCPADLNGDGLVDGFDLSFVIGQWGICK